MVDQNKTQTQAAADAPAKVAETVAATAAKVTTAAADAGKRERTAGKRRAKRAAKTQKTVRATARRSTASKRAKRSTAAKPAAAVRNERINDVTFDINSLFATPGAAPFQNLFADAGERSQDAARRTQKVAQELAEIGRANVEALVDASRVAVEGARVIGQDVVSSNREGLERAANAGRSFAEAKSPTEFLQLHSDFARSSFDRMVAESSKLTESMVKLAGEAIQPISNRTSVTAERINQIVA